MKTTSLLVTIVMVGMTTTTGFQARAYAQKAKADDAKAGDHELLADRLQRLEAEVGALRAALHAQHSLQNGSIIQHADAVGKTKPSSSPTQGKGAADGKQKKGPPTEAPESTSLTKKPDADRYRWDGKRWWYLDEYHEWLYWNGTSWASAVKTSTAETIVRSGPRARSGLVSDLLIDPQSGDVLGYTHHFEFGTDRVGENN